MKRSNRLMILIGVFLAIVAFVGVILVASRPGGGGQAAATPTPVPDVTVVYAKTDITLGTTITADMVGEKPMRPEQKAQIQDNGDLYATTGEVVGQRAGSNIAKEGYVYKGSFTPAGQVKQGEDLAPTIKSGYVGMAMEVDQVNGVGTLIVPGDRVDLILSVWMPQIKVSDATVTGQSGTKWKIDIQGGNDVSSKMIIQNRRVITTLTPPATAENANANANTNTAAGSAAPSAKPSDATIRLSSDHMMVIVEVTPQEAEVIRWAQREEKQDPQNYITLGLALRSKDDDDAQPVNTQGVTLRLLVDKWGVMVPDPMAILPKGLSELFRW